MDFTCDCAYSGRARWIMQRTAELIYVYLMVVDYSGLPNSQMLLLKADLDGWDEESPLELTVLDFNGNICHFDEGEYTLNLDCNDCVTCLSALSCIYWDGVTHTFTSGSPPGGYPYVTYKSTGVIGGGINPGLAFTWNASTCEWDYVGIDDTAGSDIADANTNILDCSGQNADDYL